MINIKEKKLCEKCFLPLEGETTVCPHCTQASNCSRFPTALPESTILQGRYVVGKVLGKGGFGITYLCYDSKTDARVCVKEYLPDTLTHRNTGETTVSAFEGEREQFFLAGAQKFYEEAQMVSRFNGNPNIISVYEFFYENNTTYFVMEYLEGIDLKQYLSQRGRCLTEGQAVYTAMKVCDALMIVHSMGILHRDISPDNIFVCNDGRIKLLDFGAARQVVGEQSKSLSVILKQGYAPIEQYQKHGKQGPWTDIYALGASIYFAVTGRTVDDAMTRLSGTPLDLSGVSPALARVLRKMLAVQSDRRFRSTFELKQALQQTGIQPCPLMSDNMMPDFEEEFDPFGTDDLSAGPISARRVGGGTIDLKAKGHALRMNASQRLSRLTASLRTLFSRSGFLKEKTARLASLIRPRWDALKTALRGKTDGAGQDAGQKKLAALIGGVLAGLILIWLCLLFFWDGLFIGVGRHADGFKLFHYILAGGLLLLALGLFVYGRVKKEKIYLAPYIAACGVLLSLSFIPIYTMPHIRVDDTTLRCYSPFYKGEISVPDNVTEIGASAFEGCDVKSITIPEGVTTIGDNAFRDCSVSSVLLPESLRSIGEGAFRGSGVAAIALPSNLTSLGKQAFADCNLSSVVLPQGVTVVDEGVFQNCASLVSATLSEDTTIIGDSAFAGCENLRDVTIPAKVEKIGQKAFSGCSSLAKVTLPGTLESLGASAFSGCKALTSANIPASMTQVPDGLFEGCENLSEMKFPKSVKQIGEASFKQSGLKTVSIPETITRIGADAFQYCASLGKAKVPRGILLEGDVFPSTLKPTWYNAHRLGFIGAGERFTVALRTNGTVAATGESGKGQIKVGDWDKIVAVAAGQTHTLGLHANGTVVAAGSDSAGQCKVTGWKNIVMIAAGANHSVGLRSDGTVVAVGQNTSGECNVKGWKDIVAVAAGFAHTVGLRADGTVVATGYDKDSRCDVSGWKNIVSIAASNSHTVGLRADGTVVATGNNEDGQCDVKKWKNIVAVAAGYFHTVGLKSDGTVVAVGFNSKDGRCNVKDWKNIVAVSAGDWHTIGLRSDGTLVAVGNKKHKQCNVSQWTELKLPPA